MRDRRWLILLILGTAALRAALAATLGPGNDEAYHALFAVRLDWSYFDHPPMMALIARAGMLLSGGRLEIWALRAGFVLLGAGSTWMMARLTARFFGERAGLIAAIGLNATAYYGIAAGTFVLPDGPLLFFWLLTLDRLAASLDEPDRIAPWIGLGLAWGGAMLSKYFAVFLPAGAVLYLVIDPPARRCLRYPGPYLAAVVGVILFSPVVLWNATHGWASFAFQGGRAASSGGFNGKLLIEAIGGQALYLMPWMWLFLWIAIVGAIRRPRDTRDKFFLSQMLLPLAMFLVVACRSPTLPHWSLVGMLPAFPIMARDWADRPKPRTRTRLTILIAAPIAGALLFAIEAQTGAFQKKGVRDHFGWIDPVSDPTTDMTGWGVVAAELRSSGLLDRPGEFLFTSKWYHSGHLAFATGDRYPILCYNPKSSHNFAYWRPSADWVGHTGTLVVINESSTEPGMFDRWFERIEPIGEFAIERAGVIIRRVRLFRCINQLAPFPDPPPTRTAPGSPTSVE